MNKKTLIALYLVFVALLIGIILANPAGIVDSLFARLPKSERMSSLEASLAAKHEVFTIVREVGDVSRLRLDARLAVSKMLGKSVDAHSAAKVFKKQPDGKLLIETNTKVVDAHDRQHKAEYAAHEAQDKESDAFFTLHAVLAKKRLDSESYYKASMEVVTSWAEVSLQHYAALQAPNDALENAIEAFKNADAHLEELIADSALALSEEETAQLASLLEANTLVIEALQKQIGAKQALLDAAHKGLKTLKARFGGTPTDR